MKNSHRSQLRGGRITVMHIVLSLEIGGMENVIYDLVTGIDLNRFRPMVLCLESLGPFGQELQAMGFDVFVASPMRNWISWLYPEPIIRVIQEQNVDVVHVHTGCWFKAAIAAKLCKVSRLILTEHLRYLPEHFIRKQSDLLASRMANHVAAVSVEMGDYLRDVLGVDARKISVVINGVNCERYARSCMPQPTKGCVLGTVARLQLIKDQATLLQAFALVVESDPLLKLHIVGDGPERGSLELLAEQLRIGERVRFLGPRRDIPGVLKGIDVFVLSSLSEGTPIALLEAMAAGKPVVATAVGEIPNILENGQHGFIVPPGSPELMAQAILCLLGDRELRERMADNNRKLVADQLSLDSMVRAYESLYAG